MAITGFIGVKTYSQLIPAILFFPLALYFWLAVVPKKKAAIPLPETNQVKKKKEKPQKLEKVEEGKVRVDEERRKFLKIIGTAGVTLFLFSIFTKKAQAAFFGSVPGPGTVSLKDSTGNVIDPAIKKPTDGYAVTEIDDSTSTAYYGFVNKDGEWFIQKEDSSGGYRYTKGSSGFTNATTGWPNRTNLSYDYFDNIF